MIDEEDILAVEENFLADLKSVKRNLINDPEGWHVGAEEVMLKLLKFVGYARFAEEYERQSENWWYV